MRVSAQVGGRAAVAVGDARHGHARGDRLRAGRRPGVGVHGRRGVRLQPRPLGAGDHLLRVGRVELGQYQVVDDPRAALVRRVMGIGVRAERPGTLGDGVVGHQVVQGIAAKLDAVRATGPYHVVMDREILAKIVQVDAS